MIKLTYKKLALRYILVLRFSMISFQFDTRKDETQGLQLYSKLHFIYRLTKNILAFRTIVINLNCN